VSVLERNSGCFNVSSLDKEFLSRAFYAFSGCDMNEKLQENCKRDNEIKGQFKSSFEIDGKTSLNSK
jgi:hypothetical protein